jgi:hypothetical protein
MNRVRHCAFFGVLTLSVLAIALCWATQSIAQHTGAESTAPPPPQGNGVLTVRVVHPTRPADAAGIAIALYALSADGTPGFASGETNADGVLTFSGISTDPAIVYLVGARYQEIPFGERVTFASGEATARAEIQIIEPTDQTAGVTIKELRVRIDWMGDKILVSEVLNLSNPGDRVIQLQEDNRDRSIVVRPIGPLASEFSAGPGSIGAGIALENGGVRFWGPLYPGEQRVEYRYSLPIPTEGGVLNLPVELAQDAGRIVVVAGTGGLEVQGPQLIASSDVKSDSGQPLKAWARAGLAAGEVFDIELTLPESRRDASLVSIPRGDVWLELDDTRMTARFDLKIEVAPGAPVAGTPDAPLLRISIPTGATLQGVAPEVESLGLIPRDDGGFDLVGPIGPGTTTLGYSVHMPTGPEGIDLGMRFPRDIETLNVLIADTGLALNSGRLHRRRPFRSGTRNFLHREAFNVSSDETVDLTLEPIRATGLSESASFALTIAAAAAGAFFLFAPLRTSVRREAPADTPQTLIQAEREAIYIAIDDLEHDFETAKIVEADYTQMRDGLRKQAIALLRSEREAAAQPAPQHGLDAASAIPATPPTPATPAASAVATSPPTTSGYCPHCGKTVSSIWRFCSHCGGDLNPAEEARG